MRILKLEFENLNSLAGTWSIDFVREWKHKKKWKNYCQSLMILKIRIFILIE